MSRLASLAVAVSIMAVVAAGCGLSDAEQTWCLGQPHANEINAAAESLGIDNSKWGTSVASQLASDSNFQRACKAAYQAR